MTKATVTSDEVRELVERLRRVKHVRTRWVEPVGEMDEVVDADMADWDGVEAVALNPDGPEAADTILALQAEIERAWQPIETAPECWVEDREVLLYLRDGSQTVSKRRMDDGSFWAGDWDYQLDATHWMPLPDPPTIREGEG